jgi:hypothetical protein
VPVRAFSPANEASFYVSMSPDRASGFPRGNSSTWPSRTELSRPSWLGNGPSQRNSNKRLLMNGNVIRVPAWSLKDQFSKGSEAWKEQSDPIFRFWAEGDWWASRSLVSVPAGISATKRRCISISRLEQSSSQAGGYGFLRRVLRPPGNFTHIRWERYPLGNDGAEHRAFTRLIQ